VLVTEPVEAKSEALKETRAEIMKRLFDGRKWKVLKEVHLGKNEQTGLPDRFKTPFGNKGSHGFVLQEVREDDQDVREVVGATVLKRAAEEFGAVELPVKQRKRRTKEQKASDDAAAAQAKASSVASPLSEDPAPEPEPLGFQTPADHAQVEPDVVSTEAQAPSEPQDAGVAPGV
jgi:hypothetical protein